VRKNGSSAESVRDIGNCRAKEGPVFSLEIPEVSFLPGLKLFCLRLVIQLRRFLHWNQIFYFGTKILIWVETGLRFPYGFNYLLIFFPKPVLHFFHF
jgi:hypothetical protein